MGSQQMLLLPSERPPQETNDDSEGTEATESKNRYERELKLKEERYLHAVVKRLCDTRRDDGAPNFILVSMMQAPEMLLTGSVITFLGGLCSVIFAPLANQTVWDDNAKVISVRPGSLDDIWWNGRADVLLASRLPSDSGFQELSASWFSQQRPSLCTHSSAFRSTRNPRCVGWFPTFEVE